MFTAVPVHTLLVSWYLFISLLTLAAYARDKSAARQMRWRTPESHLHLLALLGGWPGAWLGQRLFRHKTKKTGFRVTQVMRAVQGAEAERVSRSGTSVLVRNVWTV